MFFKLSKDCLQKAVIDKEGLRHVKERHIEVYDLIRNRFCEEVYRRRGRVIGTQGETYITLIIRQNGEHWRLVTAYPKIIKVKEEIDWDEY